MTTKIVKKKQISPKRFRVMSSRQCHGSSFTLRSKETCCHLDFSKKRKKAVAKNSQKKTHKLSTDNCWGHDSDKYTWLWNANFAWYSPCASPRICSGHEINESHWIMKCRACLLLVLLAVFVSLARSTITKSTISGLSDLARGSSFF